jgi:hypothetical protein
MSWGQGLSGVFHYEFRMQVRRPAVWIGIALPVLVMLALFLQGRPNPILPPLPMAALVVSSISYVLPISFGILLADRLPRDRQLRTAELLDSAPASRASRLWGKCLGAALATGIPLGLGYLILTAALAFSLPDLGLLPAFFPVFILMVVPGLLFVAAFSVVCTEVLPVPLYSILFTGYWIWGNVISPQRLPTISCTPLAPIGRYISIGFFGVDSGQACGFAPNQVTWLGGLGSMALLLAMAAAVLLAGQRLMGWRSEQH